MLRSTVIAAIFCLGAALPRFTAAAPPLLNDLTPRGMTVGQNNLLTLRGANLDQTARLLFSGIDVADHSLQSQDGGQAVFEVALGEQTPPGIFAVRIVTDEGISAPLAIAVDHLPQQAFASELESLPVALTGSLTGSIIMQTAFTAAQGQRVVVDVESRRLGAKLNPLVRILNDRGTQIAFSPPQNNIGGDARCEVAIPADGRYTLVLHDALYRGAGPGHFRLKIGELQYADFALPLGITRGRTAELRLVGSLSGDQAKQTVAIPADGPLLARLPAPLPPGRGLIGGSPPLFVSPFAEVMQAPTSDGSPQVLSAAPVAVSGTLSADGQQDRYIVPVSPGSKLRIEVVAAAVGSPLDGVLDVLRENGQRLAGNDDQPGSSDPALDFDVPGDVDKLVVALRDMLGRGGESFVYRLVVRPRDAPDFSLSLENDAVQIPRDGQVVVKLKAARHNYSGPIKLHVHGLPEGVSVAGTEIPPDADTALLTFSGNRPATAGIGYVEGTSVGVEPPVRRVAEHPANDVNSALPWLASELGWAISTTAPLQLAWQGGGDDKLKQGGTLAANLKLTRAEGVAGEVRLSLLTNQIMPRKKVKKDNKEEEIDDLDRALRLEGEPAIAADQAETTVNILVPADLPDRPWDLVIRGELLSANKKQVLATVFTPLRSLGTIPGKEPEDEPENP